MKYRSQKVALAYFYVAMALFAIQVLGGLLAGWIYVSPNTLSETLPFNVVRMIHTNALIVWLLLGFFGGAYYLIPEESEREIFSVPLAYVQLVILVVGTLGAVVGYLFGIHGGREFLEQPLWVKYGIFVAAVIFLVNVSLTVLGGRKTAITGILLLGLWLLSLLWVFAIINPHNLGACRAPTAWTRRPGSPPRTTPASREGCSPPPSAPGRWWPRAEASRGRCARARPVPRRAAPAAGSRIPARSPTHRVVGEERGVGHAERADHQYADRAGAAGHPGHSSPSVALARQAEGRRDVDHRRQRRERVRERRLARLRRQLETDRPVAATAKTAYTAISTRRDPCAGTGPGSASGQTR